MTALEYFREHHGDEPITKTELREKDMGLHDKLYRDGTLAEAISSSSAEIKGYRGSGMTALEYFKEHYGDEPITKTELREKDMGLYDKLYHEDNLDDAIPLGAAEMNGYRGSGMTALEYFKEHYGDEPITKTELREKDSGLYDKLYKDENLDDVTQGGYRDSGMTALEYFREHHGDEPITKTELRKKDMGLHDKLYRDGTLEDAIS